MFTGAEFGGQTQCVPMATGGIESHSNGSSDGGRGQVVPPRFDTGATLPPRQSRVVDRTCETQRLIDTVIVAFDYKAVANSRE